MLVKEVQGDKRIIAYVVPHAGMDAPDTESFAVALGVMLPEYMVPGAFVVLDGLPLTRMASWIDGHYRMLSLLGMSMLPRARRRRRCCVVYMLR